MSTIVDIVQEHKHGKMSTTVDTSSYKELRQSGVSNSKMSTDCRLLLQMNDLRKVISNR